MSSLSEKQRLIVNSNDRILMVIAGPGSGKTRVLTHRVAHLISMGTSPSSIILLTFTNKAAKNMMERIDKLVGVKTDRLLGGTFHHIANYFIRKYADLLGYKPNYSILDSQDSLTLIKGVIREEFSEFKDDLPKGEVLHKIFSYCANSMMKITDYLEAFRPEFQSMSKVIVQIRERYQEKKKEFQFMDFDDLLVNFLALLENDNVRSSITAQYKHIFVDEFQDTNRVQYEILKKLFSEGGSLFVVGDDSQSIYSFRAAEIKNMFRFKKDFPSVKIYYLDDNFRSHDKIVNVVNEIIKNNRIKFDKRLHPVNTSDELPELIYFDSARDEAEYVADRIKSLLDNGVPPTEIAVLYRSNYLSAYLETELLRRNIRYVKLGGLRFFETAHVKDVVAFLKISAGMSDGLAWERVLKLFEGVGEQTAKSVWSQIRFSKNPYQEFLMLRHKKMKAVYEVFGKIKPEDSLRDRAQKFIREFYFYYMQDRYPDSLEERMDDLNQLTAFLGYYNSIDEFLEDAMLDMDIISKDESKDRMVISTIHQAKGLEWDHVFIIGLANGRFPSKHALDDDERVEEERRLFYVACSRARKDLVMTVPLSDNTAWDFRLDLKPSIFIKEIDESFLHVWNHFDRPRRPSRRNWGGGSLFKRADELI